MKWKELFSTLSLNITKYNDGFHTLCIKLLSVIFMLLSKIHNYTSIAFQVKFFNTTHLDADTYILFKYTCQNNDSTVYYLPRKRCFAGYTNYILIAHNLDILCNVDHDLTQFRAKNFLMHKMKSLQ